MIRACTMHFTGLSPYSPSRAHEEPKLKGETHEDYEERTWPLKAHVVGEHAVIPPMAFKMALDRAAKISGKQIPGRGKATYTKFFEAGVLVLEATPVALVAEMECERVHANADGVRGSGKRVWRRFPKWSRWGGAVRFEVIAPEITKDVFEETARLAAVSVGVGRFRPASGGYFGRWSPDRFVWSA